MVDQIDLRDRHCVFPWCNRRAKTHGHWRYLALVPGTYLWTSPYGYQYLVDDQTGTTDVSSDRSRHGRRATYSTNDEEP